MGVAAVLFGRDSASVDRVYGGGRRGELARLADLYPEVVGPDNFDAHAERLGNVEAIFSTWGMWAPNAEQFARLPNLKAVFYAAGATDAFARPFLERGIAVFSAWKANAIPVAEFAASQILLSLKGFFRNVRELSGPGRWRGAEAAYVGPGAYRQTVALLGNGEISRRVQDLLKACDLDLLVIPSRPENRTIGFDEAFRRAFVVSNHLPNRDDNQHCITRDMLLSMRPGAAFINTGRGAQVDERGLVEVARRRPDLTFLIDVTHPDEPPPAGDPLYTTPNIVLTSHIAGSMNEEVFRMADYMLEEFQLWQAGQPTRFRIDASMLMTS